MAVDFSDGFETGDFSLWTGIQELGAENVIAICTAHPYAGSYGVKIRIKNAVLSDYARCYQNAAMDKGSGAHIWMSGRYFFPAGFDAEQKMRLMLIQEFGGAWQSTCPVAMNDNRELLVIDHLNSAEYTQASPIQVPLDQMVGIEGHVYVHDTAGIYEIWQDGVRIVEQTGIDTLAGSNWKQVFYGCCSVYGTWTGPDDFYFDEVFVQDSQKIPPGVVTAVPRFNPLNLKRFGGL